MTVNEFERKKILTKEEYDALLIKMSKVVVGHSFIQVNYYYDTSTLTYSNANETVRVRLKESNITFERKFGKQFFNKTCISKETATSIETLPKTIILDGNELTLIGNMVTFRSNFQLETFTVSLDKNYYLGIIDYEIEVEVESERVELPTILRIFEEKASSGKYSRFITALTSMTNTYQVK